MEEEDRRQLGRQPCVRHRLPVEAVHLARVRVDVRAVDAERRERAREVQLIVHPKVRAEPLHLGLEGRARLLELRLERDIREVALLAGERAVQLGQRLLGGGIDEQRSQVVGELVAGCSFDRPVAELLARFENLLDPDALDSRLT